MMPVFRGKVAMKYRPRELHTKAVWHLRVAHLAVGFAVTFGALAAAQGARPLPSWNDKAWDEAVAKGWTIVSMKHDWKTIFPR